MNITFHGTSTESRELHTAIAHHCQCTVDMTTGKHTSTCTPHRLLLDDQRVLDHLVFGRRLRNRLLRVEFSDELPG